MSIPWLMSQTPSAPASWAICILDHALSRLTGWMTGITAGSNISLFTPAAGGVTMGRPMSKFTTLQYRGYQGADPIPVAVAVWDGKYVCFKCLLPGEKIRGVFNPDQLVAVELTLDRLKGWLNTGCLPYHTGNPLTPTETEWWEYVRACLIHSLKLDEPKVTDTPATQEGVEQLFRETLRAYQIPAVIPAGATTDMWAELTPKGYRHIYESEVAVRMCGPKGPIHQVRVTQDPEGPFWGWWDAERQAFCMIWQSEVQNKMCFTYGPEASEARGQGLRSRLRLERIPE